MQEYLPSRRAAFVTGGSGFVGGKLIQTLVARGWEVRALARTSAAASLIEGLGATAIPGDLSHREALRKGMARSQVVFHVAAHFKLWGRREEFEEVNVEGTRHVVDAAVDEPSVRKVIAVSAAAVVMGDPEPMVGVVEERAPLQIRSFAPYSSSKAAGEQVLLAANGRRPGFETISLRPPMIWGAGMPMLDHMVETVRAGRWQWVDHGIQRMSTCHVQNLVHALLLAEENGKGGQAYFIADAEEGTLKGVIGGLLATRGVRVPDRSVSFGTAWRMAGALGVVWRLFHLNGEPPITQQMLRLIGKPFTIRTDKARRDLGYLPVLGWEKGILEMTVPSRD
jgi:nucleoside-diphosphate-sugar epimerase